MGVLKKIVQRGIFVKDKFNKEYPFDLKSQVSMSYSSFGNKNTNKNFYVIWRDWLGAGLFSNVSHVQNHIKIAENMGMIPVVDFKNFKTLYNVKNKIGGTENSWEYYFDQISPHNLDEVYSSKNVFFCNGQFVHDHQCGANNKGTKEIFDQYINLKPSVQNKIKEHSRIFNNNRVLGIHFRSKEINFAPAHSFGPTLKQIFKYTDNIIDKHNINKILIVTEDKDYQDEFIKRYGDMLYHTGAFRAAKVNSYNLNPRKNHRYLLGLEALYECMLLSKCNILLYSGSNLSCTSEMLGSHEYVYLIKNGINSNNPYVARYLYFFKKMLPKKFGGLLDEIKITKKNSKSK